MIIVYAICTLKDEIVKKVEITRKDALDFLNSPQFGKDRYKIIRCSLNKVENYLSKIGD